MFRDLEILIVEDETPLRELYAEWMAAAGASVTTAATAAEADSLWTEAFDVVLLDRRLPDGSGDDVLAARPSDQRDCLVVMITAVEPDFDIVSMGFDDYLTKPVDQEQVYETIRGLRTAASYDEAVSEYLTLVSKREMLEREKPRRELRRSDEYRRLCERSIEVRDRLTDGPDDDVLVELLLHETGGDLSFVIEYDDDGWAYRFMRDDLGGVFGDAPDVAEFVETFRGETRTNARRRSLLDLGSHRCSLHLLGSLVFIHMPRTDGSGVVCGFDPEVAPNITEFVSVVGPYLDRDVDPVVDFDAPDSTVG
jgi:DNA-binding response OmpR family regulator